MNEDDYRVEDDTAEQTSSVQLDKIVSCIRPQKLTRGCVVMMNPSSNCPGYGNAQCISDVCEELGTISLFGHNKHYNDHDVKKVIEYPFIAAGS